MENEYVVPWDRGVDRFLGGEDVMVYTVREHDALVGLGEVRCSMGGGGGSVAVRLAGSWNVQKRQ